MNAAAIDDLRPRPRDRLSRGMLLALVAHVLLVIALALGVSWRSSEPAGVEAELWAAVPKAAAPRAVEPEPEPEPPKPLPQQPQPAPEPPRPTPKVETPPPPPNRDADIAREKRDERERLERQREDEERKAAVKREQERKATAEQQRKQEQAKAEAEEKRDAEKREAERKQADKEKKAAAERQARIEAQRADNLRRIQGQAGASGDEGSPGTAAQSAGPSAGYAGRIKARIKPNITFYEDLPANPTAVVEVRVAPDGTIIGRRLTRSSGVAAWDDAVLRAIDKTEVLPRDTDGRVPPSIEIAFRPRDL